MQGFGNGRLVGISAWLGYFAAIVIVCSMVAVAFENATSLFVGDDAGGAWDNVFTSAIVVAMAFLSIIGSRVVDKAQSLIVIALLAVFAVFIAVTLVDIDFDLLAFSGYPAFTDIVASVALTFFAYLGFSVITFAAGDLRNPTRELPLAMYAALGVTTFLYIFISLGVFGTLTVDEADRLRRDGDRRGGATRARRGRVHDDGDRRAARDRLVGERDAVRVRRADLDAQRGGAVSDLLRPRLPARPRTPGSLITAGLVLVVANTVDLSAIASVGSACSLMIFLLIGLAALRLRAEIGASAPIVLVALAATAVVLVFFAVDALRNAPETFTAIVAIAVLSVVLDTVWKWMRDRGTTAPPENGAAGVAERPATMAVPRGGRKPTRARRSGSSAIATGCREPARAER